MSSSSKEEDNVEFTVKFHLMEETLTSPFTDHFTDLGRDGLVRSDPGGFVLTTEYARHAEMIYRFQPRREDVWIATFPKCGTTWMQDLVWLLVNNCNVEEAVKLPLHLRSPFIELPYMIAKDKGPAGPHNPLAMTLEKLDGMPASVRRVIKTHLPFHLLHPRLIETSKVVYVARNPKDVIVSYFYHHQLIKFHDFTGDLSLFAQYFMDDKLAFSPFFPHVLEGWAKRGHPNLLFVFYENLKKDLRAEIERVAAFLGRCISKEELDKLTEHLGFDSFSRNLSVNYEMGKQLGMLNLNGRFMRKGLIGDWKNHFSPELNDRIDRWIDHNLAGSDLKFVTE